MCYAALQAEEADFWEARNNKETFARLNEGCKLLNQK